MENDKAFAAYALTLTAGLLVVLSFAMTMSGAVPPPPMMFVEHLAMGLTVRWAYKSFGGFDWADWSLMGNHSGHDSDDAAPTAPSGGLTATS